MIQTRAWASESSVLDSCCDDSSWPSSCDCKLRTGSLCRLGVAAVDGADLQGPGVGILSQSGGWCCQRGGGVGGGSSRHFPRSHTRFCGSLIELSKGPDFEAPTVCRFSTLRVSRRFILPSPRPEMAAVSVTLGEQLPLLNLEEPTQQGLLKPSAPWGDCFMTPYMIFYMTPSLIP